MCGSTPHNEAATADNARSSVQSEESRPRRRRRAHTRTHYKRHTHSNARSVVNRVPTNDVVGAIECAESYASNSVTPGARVGDLYASTCRDAAADGAARTRDTRATHRLRRTDVAGFSAVVRCAVARLRASLQRVKGVSCRCVVGE